MFLNENIQKTAKQAIYIILVHTVMLLVLSYARQEVDILYAMSAYMFPVLVFCVIPLTAVFFLNTSFTRPAAIVLLGVMSAAIVYNIYDRFMTTPSLSSVGVNTFWKVVFEASYGIVLILEAIGFWLTYNILKEIHKKLNKQDSSN